MLEINRLCGKRSLSSGVDVRTAIVCFLLLLFSSLSQASALYTIGPDDPGALFPVPNALVSMTTAGAIAPVANMGDGSMGFNGGLAFTPGLIPAEDKFYSIANDKFSASTLFSFAADGSALTSILSLGSNFSGGLAYHGLENALYAIASDSFGASTLYRVPLAAPALQVVGALGVGFMGGLTWNEADGNLYAISFDFNTGAQRLVNSITLGGPVPSVAPLFLLGDGTLSFSGGLAYNTLDDNFFAIANDLAANSMLTDFSLAGNGAFSAIAGIGTGFINAGLALAPDRMVQPPGMPVPGTLALFAAGIAALWGRR